MREREQPGYHTGRDWMFLVVILVIAIAAVGIPIGNFDLDTESFASDWLDLNPSDKRQFYETARPTLKIEGGAPFASCGLRWRSRPVITKPFC